MAASPEIIPRGEWLAAPPRAVTPLSHVAGWYVHYVGASGLPRRPTLDQSKALMRRLQTDAFTRDYSDFEYSFAVDPCGRIFEGRGWTIQSGATLNHNSDSWSVVYLGGPDTPLTDDGKVALTELTQEGARRRPQISFVEPHSAVFATACPGDAVRAFVPYLRVHLHDSNAVAPPPPPTAKEWEAIVELAKWQKRCAAKPLERGDRGPDVVVLNDLLEKRGYHDVRGAAYGRRTEGAVHAFKVAKKLSNGDGSKCGGECAAALLRP